MMLPGELTPTDKPTVMELVAQAGLDVSDWAKFKGGQSKAASNPKYCYEWCFEQNGIYVLNLWHENMKIDEDGVFQKFNPRVEWDCEPGVQMARLERFERVVQAAFKKGCHPRVIILDRTHVGQGSATARMLDEKPWTVTSYSDGGELELRRGIWKISINDQNLDDFELEAFTEGELRQKFLKHRKREGRLRNAKMQQFRKKHGRIFCEVPGCGFDFEAKYGAIGRDFAEVHHLDPISTAPVSGRPVDLERLAVVCANCHRMIHRGGESRSLDQLLEAK